MVAAGLFRYGWSDDSWAITHAVKGMFSSRQPVTAAPALPPLTASGLRAQHGERHEDGVVQRPPATNQVLTNNLMRAPMATWPT